MIRRTNEVRYIDRKGKERVICFFSNNHKRPVYKDTGLKVRPSILKSIENLIREEQRKK